MSLSLSRDDACELARMYLDALTIPPDDRWEIVAVEEQPWGWVIPFVNERGRDDFRERLIGYGPLLVERASAEVFLAGSAPPLERWIDEWRSRKRPSLERPPAWRAPEPWADLRWLWATDGNRSAIRRELDRELAPDHPLFGDVNELVAKCGHCDSVAVRRASGAYAIVHLTWSRSQESSPWPRWDGHDGSLELREAFAAHGMN